MTRISQEQMILQHLRKNPITPKQALSSYGCFRLAARIKRLRDAGHHIETKRLRIDEYTEVAQYFLIKEAGTVI